MYSVFFRICGVWAGWKVEGLEVKLKDSFLGYKSNGIEKDTGFRGHGG